MTVPAMPPPARSPATHPVPPGTRTLVHPTIPPRSRSDRTRHRRKPAGRVTPGVQARNKPSGKVVIRRRQNDAGTRSNVRQRNPSIPARVSRRQQLDPPIRYRIREGGLVESGHRDVDPVRRRRGIGDLVRQSSEQTTLADAGAASNRPRPGRVRCPASIAAPPARPALRRQGQIPVQPNPENPSGRVQPIERGMNKDVAACSRLKGRGQAHMAETHRGDARERCGPGIERAGDKRMEVIDIHWSRIVMRRRCGSERAGSDQIHHDQDNALYATEVPSDFINPRSRMRQTQ